MIYGVASAFCKQNAKQAKCTVTVVQTTHDAEHFALQNVSMALSWKDCDLGAIIYFVKVWKNFSIIENIFGKLCLQKCI
ncbi:MAG: hypothetical protein EOO35_00565 [Cyanobacteriota bacterium]|nr:MAG: hypothetical protein EOO35_00565 [Cyanobacteriota bacterium]